MDTDDMQRSEAEIAVTADVSLALTQSGMLKRSLDYANSQLSLGATVTADGTGQFPTIQTAIDASPENALIRLGPGIYREPLLLRKSVQIIGASGAETVLQSDAPECMTIEGGACLLKNLTIQVAASSVESPDEPQTGIFASGGACSIEDCRFLIKGSCGIDATGGSEVSVRSTSFTVEAEEDRDRDSPEPLAISIRDGAKGTVENSHFSVSGSGGGIAVSDRGAGTLTENVLSSSTDSLYAVFVGAGAVASIQSNQASGFFTGIDVGGGIAWGQGNHIRGSDDPNAMSPWYGIAVKHAGGFFSHNDISNVTCGMKVESGGGVIDHNMIHDCGTGIEAIEVAHAPVALQDPATREMIRRLAPALGDVLPNEAKLAIGENRIWRTEEDIVYKPGPWVFVLDNHFEAPAGETASEKAASIIASTAAASTEIVVAKEGPADFHTIRAAVDAAAEAARIIIRPGNYSQDEEFDVQSEHNIHIEKRLEILGDGPTGEILVDVDLWLGATGCVLRNLSLRRGVHIFNPALVEDCIVRGRISIQGKRLKPASGQADGVVGDDGQEVSETTIRRCTIATLGIDVDAAGATIEGNEIEIVEENGNAPEGITISRGFATVKQNRIMGEGGNAVQIGSETAGADIIDNDISGGFFSGIEIKTGECRIEKNRIHNVAKHVDGGTYGAAISVEPDDEVETVRVGISDNEIFANARAGIVLDGAFREVPGRDSPGIFRKMYGFDNPNGPSIIARIVGNRVSEHPLEGISVTGGAQVTIEGNYIWACNTSQHERQTYDARTSAFDRQVFYDPDYPAPVMKDNHSQAPPGHQADAKRLANEALSQSVGVPSKPTWGAKVRRFLGS